MNDRARTLANPMANGIPVTAKLKAFADGPTMIPHGLGFTPNGWSIVDPGTAPITIPVQVSKDKKYLVLQNQVAAVITLGLWVF